MKQLLSLGLVAFVVACASAHEAAPDAAGATLAGARPNIVFIFSDDHATHAISAYGSRIATTPNIDRIAREGVLFRNCFCGNSICGPSRATVLTGKHSHQNGFMRNGNRFDGAQTTLPKLLQRAGYQTALVGKWHLESEPTGFDHWRVLPGQGQYYNPDFLSPNGRERLEGHCTDLTTDMALRWLGEQRDPKRPFLLMCQHKAPHRPWQPAPADLGLLRGAHVPEPATLFDDWSGRGPAAPRQEMTVARHLSLWADLHVVPTDAEAEGLRGHDATWRAQKNRMTEAQRAAWDAAYDAEDRAFRAAKPEGDDLVRWQYQRYIQNYLRCVAGVDRSVGALLAAIDADPALAANTIVVYSSDQGFFLGDHGWYDKRWMYEESLRMPLVVRWPGHVRAGVTVDALVQNIDFMPTFLELAGVALPGDVHGRSLAPLLAGDAPRDWRDAIYYHFYESHAVHEVAAHYGVRTATHKLLRFYEPEVRGDELYDLVADPDEMKNVAADPAYAAVRAELDAKLAALRAQYGDTTGVLDASFDRTAGIAALVATKEGFRLWANGTGGYALRSRTPTLTGPCTFTCEVYPAVGRPPGDGLLVVQFGDTWQRTVRAGIDFAGKALVLQRGIEEVARTPLSGPTQWFKLDSTGMVPVGLLTIEVTVDPVQHTVVATAEGGTVRAALPRGWTEVTAVGYGASNAAAEFTEVRTAP